MSNQHLNHIQLTPLVFLILTMPYPVKFFSKIISMTLFLVLRGMYKRALREWPTPPPTIPEADSSCQAFPSSSSPHHRNALTPHETHTHTRTPALRSIATKTWPADPHRTALATKPRTSSPRPVNPQPVTAQHPNPAAGINCAAAGIDTYISFHKSNCLAFQPRWKELGCMEWHDGTVANRDPVGTSVAGATPTRAEVSPVRASYRTRSARTVSVPSQDSSPRASGTP